MKLRDMLGSSTAMFGRSIALALMTAFLALRIWDPQLLEYFRLRTFDFYQSLAPRPNTAGQVLIIDIDEKSLKAVGQWPWPRTKLAELVERIAESGAVAAAFDIIFPEPDRLSPGEVAKFVQGIDDATRTRLETLPSNDAIFGGALRAFRVVVSQSGQNSRITLPSPASDVAPALGVVGPDPSPFLVSFDSLLTNVEEIDKFSAGRGLFTIRPDSDGIVRRVPIIMQAAGKIRPALAIELLRVATGGQATLVRVNDLGVTGIVVGGVTIPTDANGRFWMYFNAHSPARFVSASDVLSGAAGRQQLEGKLVFIGTSAIGLNDSKVTPLDPAMPGVEVQAQLVENIMSGHYLTRPAYLVGAEVVLAAVIALTIIVLVPYLGALAVLLIGFFIAVVLFSGSFYLFKAYGILLDTVYPVLSSFAIFWSLVFVNYFKEQTQRQVIRGAFAQYISPALVEQLARNPGKLKLGGETKELTILFSDVRDFTSLAESYKTDPQGLTRLVNRLLTPLSRAIVNQKGTIDKYMGDNVMAFWNAPLDDQTHVKNACRAALNMLVEVNMLNMELRSEAEEAGKPFVPLSIGVGINTGECVVGNMGSHFRFDYTVLGDSVNLASRLEGQSKFYRTPIIIGARTNAVAKNSFHTVPIDYIRVKGRSEPEHVYALIRKRNKPRPGLEAIESLLADMLKAYRQRQWARVSEILEGSRKELKTFGLAGLADLYQQRVDELMRSPPPPDWDGVYTALNK